MIIGIRREDKNRWERRVPLAPDDLAQLKASLGIEFHVQPSPIRIFADSEFAAAGAELREDLSACDLIMGVKEVPTHLLMPAKNYLYFAHVIKCQASNMPMLQRLLDLGCALFDYELITDEQGRRLVFFGRYAGLAGMIDSLHALGRRLEIEGVPSPFAEIKLAHEYKDLPEALEAIDRLGAKIRVHGLDPRITPLVVGFAGYGHASQGAQEILDRLPVKTITPAELAAVRAQPRTAGNEIYKVVFKEEHLVTPREQKRFELREYYDHPEKYRSIFDAYLPHLTMLVNCIFWTARYPRLVTKRAVAELYRESRPHLRVIGDISCDIDGSIEVTGRSTTPDQPCFVYEASTGRMLDGYAGNGPVVLAVDNLPCELPRESSVFFSHTLRDFLGAFAGADLTAPVEAWALPEPMKRALIAARGELRPRFDYIKDCLAGVRPDAGTERSGA
ncbi:MAG: bifunctional lysine ketoglutarate reductase /saccharopine dehydrogenase family protein [Candidatus Eisenbacteria bacterium]